MIYIFSKPQEQMLNEIVQSAFERSCGIGSTSLLDFEDFIKSCKVGDINVDQKFNQFSILIFLNPPEEISPTLISILENYTSKVIMFGKLPDSLAEFLDITASPVTEQMKLSATCEPAKTYQYSESLGTIVYKKSLEINANKQTLLPSRALCRFDFTNEWNNLGFGAITIDDSMWAISQKAVIPERNVVAELISENNILSAYAGNWDFPKASLLWFNRSVGPVDSYEWFFLEQFIAKYRFGDIPSWPVISEIPYGCESAVTMRLDCDEDIESARALSQAYDEKGIPFSLALHATVLSSPDQYKLPKDVLQAGGAILSHTLTHAPNWGGNEEAAKYEGEESSRIIQETIGIKPYYAVSPFHHTPGYAREGLKDAGYQGVVGGIISNDPDFVMARAGRPPNSKHGFIGHTQQCMFHGDCLLKDGDPLSIYQRAYEQAKISKTFFGYLDHPFSARYQYGWNTEAQRIEAHKDFIQYMKSSSDKIIFLNQDTALNFLRAKSLVRIHECDGKLQVSHSGELNNSSGSRLALGIAIQYGANVFQLASEGIFL